MTTGDTIAMLERIIECCGPHETDKRARAYAALTLSRVLHPVWTHVVPKRDANGKIIGQETITKPAGELSGDRAALERRLLDMIATL